MRYLYGALIFGAVLSVSGSVLAQAPAGATALCKDNSYYTGSSHRGACSRHGGVQQWLGVGTTATPAVHHTSEQAAPQAAPATHMARRSESGPSPSMNGAAYNTDQVWVNTATKVYHCANDPWYGKTSRGEYMAESQAKADGFRPDHNRSCAI